MRYVKVIYSDDVSVLLDVDDDTFYKVNPLAGEVMAIEILEMTECEECQDLMEGDLPSGLCESCAEELEDECEDEDDWDDWDDEDDWDEDEIHPDYLED